MAAEVTMLCESQAEGRGRYAYELQLHHACCATSTCQLVNARILATRHFNPLSLLFSTSVRFFEATTIMASLRSSRTLLRRFARPAPPAFRLQPFATPLQRRSLASHQDATYSQVPYEKAESVGKKRFSQFDVEGKVFVVTGAACRPPPILRASTMLL